MSACASIAPRNALRVFSGKVPLAPRWAMLSTARLHHQEKLKTNNGASVCAQTLEAQTSGRERSTGTGTSERRQRSRPGPLSAGVIPAGSNEIGVDAKVLPGNMARPTATKLSYTRATFRTPAHLADEAAGILV